MQDKTGQAVPRTVFKIRVNHQWQTLSSDELFKGKTVVVFALPGAFTPTCSSAHVPRYNELAPVFKANGVDEIVCISVNDAFVMAAWQEDQGAEQIRFIADGNGEFTQAMGMLVDKRDLGFGWRSWRYSMLVRDGVIEKMFIEPDRPGDPFEVSDADTMLEYINPRAQKPLAIGIVTRPGCPFCARAKQALAARGLAYREIVVGRDIDNVGLRAWSGQDTVPQVFVEGEHIGGSEALDNWLNTQMPPRSA